MSVKKILQAIVVQKKKRIMQECEANLRNTCIIQKNKNVVQSIF